MRRLDEREIQEENKYGRLAFQIMFFSAAAVILLQMLIYKADIQQVAGETVILLIGGFVYLAALVRQGIWTNESAVVKNNLIISFCISAVFATVLAVICYQKAPDAKLAGQDAWLLWSVGSFFLFMILGMAVLTLFAKSAKRKREEFEEKYGD